MREGNAVMTFGTGVLKWHCSISCQTGAEGAATLTPNADDEAVLYRRHAMATLVGTVESNATLSLPLAPGVAVEQDALGNWIAPFVPLHPASNGQVRVQLKAEKAGQNPAYRLASFSANQSSTALRYDGNGALLNLPSGLNLSYDAEGNLEMVSSNGTAVTENWYDAIGRRIAKREGGVLTLYLWDGMEILATANADGTLREYYSRGPGIAGDVGSLIAEHSFGTGQTVFLHSNHRGDVVLATDNSGAAVGRYEYSAFGMQLAPSGAYVPRFGFSSKERDASGLVYYGLRFYSAELCRWITPDPIRESGGVNLYRFCGNDPVNLIDPLGLSEEKCRNGDQILGNIRRLFDAGQFLPSMLVPGVYPRANYEILIMMALHSGPWALYDFKSQDDYSDFSVDGSPMSLEEFGNFVAGYSAGYGNTPGLYVGVRLGGIAYANLFRPREEPWDDSDSVPAINAGFDAGRRARKR